MDDGPARPRTSSEVFPRRILHDASPQQRTAVTLSCREGLATKDIAAVLNVSEATVRVHLHRALSTLRRRLGDEG